MTRSARNVGALFSAWPGAVPSVASPVCPTHITLAGLGPTLTTWGRRLPFREAPRKAPRRGKTEGPEISPGHYRAPVLQYGDSASCRKRTRRPGEEGGAF